MLFVTKQNTLRGNYMSRDSKAKRELNKLKDMDASVVPVDMWPEDIKKYNAKVTAKKIVAKNNWQDRYLTALRNDEHVIGVGPAGTGKTYLAAAVAAELLLANQTQQIILTRPPVECGEKLGFLPGSIMEKYAPYIQPFQDGLASQLGFTAVKRKIEDEKCYEIQPQPINFVRGRTFDNSIILLDEAQNIDVKTMKAILTRVGENCRMFITGDIDQTDLVLRNGEISGLQWWINSLRKHRPEVEIVDFTDAPCVRSAHCAWVLDVFKKVK
jgi:phosphate starvation-inducible PhoH-like protein